MDGSVSIEVRICEFRCYGFACSEVRDCPIGLALGRQYSAIRSGLVPSVAEPHSYPLAMAGEGQWIGMS